MIKFSDILNEIITETDPKVGTGKKPEGSSRRLYTDENPKDTVSIKFKTVQDIKDTLSKTSFKSKPHARQSQIINLIHQRVRAAYSKAKDPEVKARLKRALDYIEGRKEASKKKTERLRKLKEFEGDSNPLNLPYTDTWHNGQYKAQDGKTEEAIKLMTKAADEAEKYAKETQDDGINGEAGYYRGTIAWLKKDYNTVTKYINDTNVKITGNDEVLKRLLKNKDKSYKEAYNFPEQKEGETINRKNLDFFDLVNKGIIFVTEPFGDGKKQKSNWDGDSNIITLWNLKHPEQSQEWVFDAVKYPKPEAIQWWNDEGQFTLKDEKYHQILRSIELYNNSNKQEQNESELTERCWKGYTQKGMKTMFGKRYPNCVKK